MKVDERELDRIQAIILSMTPAGAPPAGADQGLAAAAHRPRLRHERAGGQPDRQAVRPDAQGDAPGRARASMPDLGALMRQRALTPAARGDGGGCLEARASGRSQGRVDRRSREEHVAVRLRLTRVGGKKDPMWRVVVADQRSPRDGRVIETSGTTTRRPTRRRSTIDEERVRAAGWRAARSRRSTVRKLLRIQGIAELTAHAGGAMRAEASCSSTWPKGLVDEPEAVAVEQFEEDDGTVVLELRVGDDDYGKVIGRGGRTAARAAHGRQAAAAGDGQRVLRRHRRLSADRLTTWIIAGRRRAPPRARRQLLRHRTRGRACSRVGTTVSAAGRDCGDRASRRHRSAPDRAPGRVREPRRRAGAARPAAGGCRCDASAARAR